MKQNGIGAPAPPLELPTATGSRGSLGEFRGKPVVLSFLGPANCAFCRAHVIRMIQARDDIRKLGAEVVLVAYHDPELLTAKMLHSLDLPYVLLLDRERAAYARWGLGQPDFTALLRPGLYWASLRVLLSGEPWLGSVPDQRQLGGDFVIDRNGTLVFANRMKGLHDRAKVPDLLAAMEERA